MDTIVDFAAMKGSWVGEYYWKAHAVGFRVQVLGFSEHSYLLDMFD
jgi:hypothetical protein